MPMAILTLEVKITADQPTSSAFFSSLAPRCCAMTVMVAIDRDNGII